MPDSVTGPKISVVDSITDGASYGDIGRAFLRMFQTLIQPNVISIGTTAPPVSPTNGATYVIGASPTGAWVGKAQNVAYWTTDDPDTPSGKWDFYAPTTGWVVTNQSDLGQYAFNGSTWVGQRVGAFNFQVDGAGSAITTGVKGQWNAPCNCTITSWTLTSDQSGSVVVDVLKSTYANFPSTSSIAGADKPTLSSVQKNRNLSLSSWTTALVQGDELQININSASTVTRVNLTIGVTIP